MKKYSRVSYETRCQINAFLQAKFSIPEIAKRLGCHKSTIYRELKRNINYSGTYAPKSAHDLARRRYSRCRKNYLMQGVILDLIIEKLKIGWSPEQISGRLKKEKIKAPSHSSIYKYIYGDRCREKRRPYRRDLAIYLRKHGKRGAGRYVQRKHLSQSGTSIRYRPQIVKQRKRIGDWERDTMHTANGVQILVMNDRKSRLTKLSVLESRKNSEVDSRTRQLIEETNRKAFTITNDNGADFKGTKGLPYKVFFCDPYKPQQRGTVENTIGLLRQYIKRNTDVRELDMRIFENILNNRPRKVLDYQTPHEVYFKKKVALASLI